MLLGNYGVSDKLVKEVAQLAAAKGALFWQAAATLLRACVLVLTDQQTSVRQLLAAVIARPRSTESSFSSPYFLTYLAMSHTRTGETKAGPARFDAVPDRPKPDLHRPGIDRNRIRFVVERRGCSCIC
jgi:hypothetical protein